MCGITGRVEPLPIGTATAAWRRLGKQIQLHQEPGCAVEATQVDHIVNVGAGGAPLDPANLAAACPSCNARKAQREATRAR
jgi:5-methylcytosine-specific restriction endonuclease McrA